MTKVSRRFLDKELWNRIFEIFVKTLADLKTPIDVQNFLEDLLSPTEKVMLTKRLAIAILLAKGYTYDEIDDKLKVSRSTIMNVSFWLKYGKSGYAKSVEKIIKNQNRDTMIDKIDEILLQLSPPKAYGSPAYERKQKRGKELFRKRVKRELL